MRMRELSVLTACCALMLLAMTVAQRPIEHNPTRTESPQSPRGSQAPPNRHDSSRPSVCDPTDGHRVPSWCNKDRQPSPTRPTRTNLNDPCNPILGRELPSWCRNPNTPSPNTRGHETTIADECKPAHGHERPSWCRNRNPESNTRPVQPSPNDPCIPILGHELPSWCRNRYAPPNSRDRRVNTLSDGSNPARGSQLPSWRGRSSSDSRISDLNEACKPVHGRPLPSWCRNGNPSTAFSRNRQAQSNSECNPFLGRRLPPWCDTRQPLTPSIRDGPNAILDECHPSRGALLPAWCGGRRRLRAAPVAPSCHNATPATADVYVPYAGQRLDVFDWRLVREMNTLVQTNAVVSTLGVKMVLGMLHEAASRASAEELRRALGLPVGRPSARDAFRRILTTLQERNPGYVMRVANRVYLDESYEPRTGIANIYNSHYNAEIERVTFKNPAVVKPKINTWVSNFTNGIIKNLITNDRQIQDLITMILNVIYFKGQWRHSFPKNKTTKGDFYVTPQKNVTVDYMHLTTDLYFCASKKLDGKILRLPYAGKKYSMFLILPNKKENFDDMIQRMTPEMMREQLHALSKVEVNVKLPKFKFEYTVHVKEILQRLGLTRIFTHSDEINLTKNKTNLVISKIIQKVALDVNEEGTEATSVTEINLQNMFGGQNHFIATHPFLFFVEEEKTGTIVFIGKVIDPSTSKSQHPLTRPGNPVIIPTANILEKDFSPDISVQNSDNIAPPVVPSQQE